MKKLIILPLLATMAMANVTVCEVGTPNDTKNLVFIEKQGSIDMFSKGKSLALNRGITIIQSSTEDGTTIYQSNEASPRVKIAINTTKETVNYTFDGHNKYFSNCKVL